MQKFRVSLLIGAFQVLLAASAAALAILVHAPLASILGLLVLGASAVIPRASASKSIAKWCLVAAWIGALPVLCGPTFPSGAFTIDPYYALIPGLIAGVFFLTTSDQTNLAFRAKWERLGFAWGFLAGAVWLVASYVQCLIAQFQLALLLAAALLVFCRFRFKLRSIGIQFVNTLVLLLVVVAFLPVVDSFRRVHSRDEMFDDPEKYYTYEAAKKDRGDFSRWSRYFEEQWASLCQQVMEADPDYPVPPRLRRGSHGTLLRSSIAINRQGFRGPEIPADKGNTYRIVALGESTTFGFTMRAGDKPWPALLEDMIHERLKLVRPVEVINGGIPSYSLAANLLRFRRDILPVKPDTIISYHGYNGFRLINGNLPPPVAKPPPRYQDRPALLLADFEYTLKLVRYKKRLLRPPLKLRATITDPHEYRIRAAL